MGMNPETHKFEELADEPAMRAAYARSWKVFAIGEKVTIKQTDFSVVDISPNKLVLRPYGTDTLTAKAAYAMKAKLTELEKTQSSESASLPPGPMDAGTASTPMPQYRSHKKVYALKISAVSSVFTMPAPDGDNHYVNLAFEDSKVFAPGSVQVDNRPMPEPGWYYVVYEDGYHSFSPAAQFEEGYTRI